MADLNWSDFLKRVGASGGATETLPNDGVPNAIDPEQPEAGFGQQEPFDILPASKEAFGQVVSTLERNRLARPERVDQSRFADPDFATKLGARAGVPFDTSSGIPFLSRVASEREPTQEEQLMALRKEYGENNVRLNKLGQPVVTTVDENGKEKDVLANPLGLDWTDLSTVVTQSPEILGSVLTTVLPAVLTGGATVAPGVLKALGTLGLSTLGAEAGGAAKDIFRRWAEGRDIDPTEVTSRHAVSGAENLAYGAGMGVLGFVGGRLISPLSKPGRLNFDAIKAHDLFLEKYNVDLPMTAGQKTGAPFLMASEAVAEQMPGSRTAFSKFRQKQRDLVDKLRSIASGRVDDEEQTGKKIVETFKTELSPLEYDVDLAAKEAAELAEKAIKTTIGSPADKVALGQAVETGVKAKKAAFDAVNKANYDEVFNNPLATQRIIGGSKLKQAVDDMISELPAIEKDVTKATGLVDASGRPIMTTVTEEIPVTTPVRERLEEISKKLSGNGRLSLNDLKQIRTDVDNAIKTGEAVPGVKEGRLKNYYSALSQAIEKGIDDIGDTKLKAAWKDATDHYKKNVGKFEKAGIAELFRDPINALSPDEIVDRATRSPGVYRAYKEFFGPTAPQVAGIQQAARDSVLDLGQVGKSLDAQSFAQRIEALDRNSPELLRDAFGSNAVMLRDQALIMQRAAGAQIPKAELDRALASGTLSADRLRDMITAETRRADAYANTLVKDLAQGTIKPDKIRPTEVVDKFVFRPETQPAHLEELMQSFSKRPEAQEDLRRLAFVKTLDKATVMGRDGESILSAQALDTMLRDENLAKKLRTVLGDSNFEDLAGIRDFLKPTQLGAGDFKGAGSIGGSMLINRLFLKGELSAIPTFVKNFVLGSVYTIPAVRDLVSNNVLKEEGKALVVNGMIASEPWIRALTMSYEPRKATEVQANIKYAIDRMVAKNPEEGKPGVTKGTEDIPWDQFLKRVGAPTQ